jgi:hypothetical protein
MGQVHLKIHNNFPDSNSSDEAKQWFAILNRISVFEGEVRGAQDQLEQSASLRAP